MSFVETYRGVITQADCDHLGHMNAARYVGLCGDAVIALQTMWGVTPDDVRNGRRISFAVVRMESDFTAEVQVGEAVVMKTAVLAVGGKSMLLRHQLLRADGVVAFDSQFRAVLFDLVNRRAAEIPPQVRAKAEAMIEV